MWAVRIHRSNLWRQITHTHTRSQWMVWYRISTPSFPPRCEGRRCLLAGLYGLQFKSGFRITATVTTFFSRASQVPSHETETSSMGLERAEGMRCVVITQSPQFFLQQGGGFFFFFFFLCGWQGYLAKFTLLSYASGFYRRHHTHHQRASTGRNERATAGARLKRRHTSENWFRLHVHVCVRVSVYVCSWLHNATVLRWYALTRLRHAWSAIVTFHPKEKKHLEINSIKSFASVTVVRVCVLESRRFEGSTLTISLSHTHTHNWGVKVNLPCASSIHYFNAASGVKQQAMANSSTPHIHTRTHTHTHTLIIFIGRLSIFLWVRAKRL